MVVGRTAEELVQDCIRSTRRSAGAADEAGRDGGGRKKGRFVRMVKVEETLTRAVLPGPGRTRRASWLFRKSLGRMPKKEEDEKEEEDEEATAVDAEEACEESGNGDDESGRVG